MEITEIVDIINFANTSHLSWAKYSFYSYVTRERVQQFVYYMFDEIPATQLHIHEFLLDLFLGLDGKARYCKWHMNISGIDWIYNEFIREKHFTKSCSALLQYPEFQKYAEEQQQNMNTDEQKQLAIQNMRLQTQIKKNPMHYWNRRNIHKLDEDAIHLFLTEENTKTLFHIMFDRHCCGVGELAKYLSNNKFAIDEMNNKTFYHIFCTHLRNNMKTPKQRGNIHQMLSAFEHYNDFIGFAPIIRRGRIAIIYEDVCVNYDRRNIGHKIFADEVIVSSICKCVT